MEESSSTYQERGNQAYAVQLLGNLAAHEPIEAGRSFATVLVVVALTLAVWVFFYFESMPLDAASTSIVALVCTVVVLSAKRLWSCCRRKGA